MNKYFGYIFSLKMNSNIEECKKYLFNVIKAHNSTYNIAELLKMYTKSIIKSTKKIGVDIEYYEFRNHHWSKIDNIEDTIIYLFNKLRNDILINSLPNEQNEIKELFQKIFNLLGKHLREIISYYNLATFDSIFAEKIATPNLNLLCFTNGVYELDTKKFRDGHPDDYICSQFNFDYGKVEHFDEMYCELFNYLCGILPDNLMRNYALMKIANYCFSKFATKINLLGDGSNGKTKFVKLLKLTMGDRIKISRESEECFIDRLNGSIIHVTNTVSELIDEKFCIIPFEQKFVNRNSTLKQNESYACDISDSKFMDWRQAFVSLLLEYVDKDIPVPKKCEELFIRSRFSPNEIVIKNFIDNNLLKTTTQSNVIGMTDLYNRYVQRSMSFSPPYYEFEKYCETHMKDNYDAKYKIIFNYV